MPAVDFVVPRFLAAALVVLAAVFFAVAVFAADEPAVVRFAAAFLLAPVFFAAAVFVADVLVALVLAAPFVALDAAVFLAAALAAPG